MSGRSLRSYGGIALLAAGVIAALLVANRLSRALFERPPPSRLPAARVAPPAAVTASAAPAADGSLFQVVTSEGGVEAYREGKWIAIQRGDLLTAADVVRTLPGARAVLKVGETTEIELRENVELRLDRLSGTEAAVDLRQGKVVARVTRPGDILVVNASDTRTANEGPAHFIVMAAQGPGAKVAVTTTEGKTRFKAGGKEVTVPAGQASRSERGAPPSDPEAIPEEVILSVVWPEAEMHTARAPIRGTAGAMSVVTINGARIPVGADGRFATSVPLREGENVVQVEAEDLTGRRKTTRTTLVRPPTQKPKLTTERTQLWTQ